MMILILMERAYLSGKATQGGADPSVPELREEITTLKQKIIEKDVLIGNFDIRISELEEEKFQTSK